MNWVLITVFTRYILICYAFPMDETSIVEESLSFKICNITVEALGNTTLNEIEKEIRKVLTYNDNMLNVVVEEIKLISHENYYALCNERIYNVLTKYMKNNLREEREKQQKIKDISNKLDKLVIQSFQNASSAEDKRKILERIRKRYNSTVRQRNMLSSRHNSTRNTLNVYKDLIEEGIKQTIDKTTVKNNTRRTAVEFNSLPHVNASGDDYDSPSTKSSDLMLTTEYDCDIVVKQTCAQLKDLKVLVCTFDHTAFTIDKLCDGVMDCPDGSDEQNCVKQAVQRVHQATQIIPYLESTRECFNDLFLSPVFTKQNKMLSDLLKRELEFLKKYTDYKVKFGEYVNESDKGFVTELATEVSAVVSTFFTALNGAVCVEINENTKDFIHRYDEELNNDLERTVEQVKWSPKSCVCDGERCKNTTCLLACSRLCYRTDKLRRWGCEASSGQRSVSLNEICDGKPDCYDESDEIGCVKDNTNTILGATNIFDSIYKLLKITATMSEYEPVKKEFLLLRETIEHLKERSLLQKNRDIKSFRALRDRIFSMLSEIYVQIVDEDREIDKELEFQFMLSINDKLVGALKRSQTGNERVISSEEDCFCQKAECVMRICSKTCIRTCFARPTLTTYSCNNSIANSASVPIDAVCNGKRNCPNGEDEIDCKQEICRNHHLMVLRRFIMTLGEKSKETVQYKQIESWTTKVIATLKIEEKRERLTPHTFKEIVTGILDDLVTAYSLIEQYRRTDNALRRFKKLAQPIIESLKACAM